MIYQYALNKARDFVNKDDITVILGDNILFGNTDFLKEPLKKVAGYS